MMRKILGALLAAIALLTGIAYLLPRAVHVERAVTIDRPAAVIFPYINSLRRADEWSPWKDYDPNVSMTYSGPDAGVGARMSWAGNKQVGSGSQMITESVADRSVASDLPFGGEGPAKAALALDAAGAATRVLWSLDMDVGNNPVSRYVGLFMDRMVGPDYERGLAKLKALVERTAPAAAPAQPAIAPTTAPNAPTS